MPALNDLVEEVTAFRHYLRAERGMADNTVTAYGHDLDRYAAWFADRPMRDFRSPTLGELADYLGFLREEELELQPGTQPGETVVLRGRGMPTLQGFGRGDERILVNVLVPRQLNDEQRRLLREFDDHADEQTYDKPDGFFDKLKSAFR